MEHIPYACLSQLNNDAMFRYPGQSLMVGAFRYRGKSSIFAHKNEYTYNIFIYIYTYIYIYILDAHTSPAGDK